MKITFILPVYWPAIGGCEIHTHELVKRLSDWNDVRVITRIIRQEDKPKNGLWCGTLVSSVPRGKEYLDNKAEVIPLHLGFLERKFLYPFVRGYRKMEGVSTEVISHTFQRKIFRLINNSDLIHCVHNGASYYGYTSLKCARKLGVPFVFTPLLQIHQGLNEKLIAEERHGKSGIRSQDMHNLRLHLSPMGYHDKYWLNVCKEADALIAMTAFEKEFLSGKGIDHNKIHEVGVGPVLSDDYNQDEFRNRYGIGNSRMVLFLGRKHESKGIEELLRAAGHVWKTHPQTYFCFVGPKEGKAPTIFKKYNDKRIIEIDKVDLQEKTSALAACDVFCMPSFYEALGVVFLEAWMFEYPVIAGNTPPLAELLGHGKGGITFDLVPETIAEKIVQLLDSKDLCKSMGKGGKKRVLSNYSWELIAGKIENIYQSVLTINENKKCLKSASL